MACSFVSIPAFYVFDYTIFIIIFCLKEKFWWYSIVEKAKEFHKNIYFCFIDYAKVFDYVDHNKLENSSKDGNARQPYLSPEKPTCRSRSNR